MTRTGYPATIGRAWQRICGIGLVLAALAVATGCASTGGTPGSHWSPTSGPSAGSPPASPGGTPPAHLDARRLPVTLPVPLSDCVLFVDGTGLLVAGGLTAKDSSSDTVLRVDPGAGQVRSVGRLVAPVHDAAGFTLAGADLLLGGGTGASVATVQLIRPGLAGQVLGALPEPRSDLVATTVDGVGYVLGGYTGSRMLASVLRTTDGRAYQSVASIAVPVRYPALAASDGVLWLFGGTTGDGRTTDVVQRVDLNSGTAQVVGHLPVPVSHAAGFALGTAVYLAGGRTASGTRTDAIWRIAPDGTATRVGTLPAALSDAGVAVSGGSAYLVGGLAPTTVGQIVEIRAAG